MAIDKGIVLKSGAWFTFGEERVQGRDALKKLLTESPVMLKSLEEKVKAILGITNVQKSVSYTHLRAHETVLDIVCSLLLEKKKNPK